MDYNCKWLYDEIDGNIGIIVANKTIWIQKLSDYVNTMVKKIIN